MIDLIGCGAKSAAVAAATLDAINDDLGRAADDAGVSHSFWLLTQIPEAARKDDFAGALRGLGFQISDLPSGAELLAGFTAAVDRFLVAAKTRSGPAELGQLAAVETLATLIRDRTPSLFAPTPGEIRSALAKAGTEVQFGKLARSYFARFTERYVSYFLSKELPQHVGPGRRFVTLGEERSFASALELHCQQACKIVEVFSGAWYSKNRFQRTLTSAGTGRFLAYALKKVRSELRRGGSAA